jgi:hypothetical protein
MCVSVSVCAYHMGLDKSHNAVWVREAITIHRREILGERDKHGRERKRERAWERGSVHEDERSDISGFGKTSET